MKITKRNKKKKSASSTKQTMSSPRAGGKGTLELEVIEAEELSERRRESTVFCQVSIDGDVSSNDLSSLLSSSNDASMLADADLESSATDGVFMTPAVPRTSTPVWEHVLVCAIASVAQRVVVRVVDGVPGAAQGNKVIGTVQVDLSKVQGNYLDDVREKRMESKKKKKKSSLNRLSLSLQWFEIMVKRGKSRGKLHLCLKITMSGMDRLLSTVAADSGDAAQHEKESMSEFLKAMPGLVKQIRYTANRLVYAIGPVLMLRKNVVDLLLWRSKPVSAFSFAAFLYLAYHEYFLHVAFLSLGVTLLWQAVASLRPGTGFVRAELISPNEVIDRGNQVKDETRVGIRTSLLTDVRTVVRLLEGLAELAERARELACNPQRAAIAGGAFVFAALFFSFVNLHALLAFAAHYGLTFAGLYLFTFGALYENFPRFRERYSLPRLVSKAKQTFMARVLGREAPVDAAGKIDEGPSRAPEELWAMVLRLQDPKSGVPCRDRRPKRRRKGRAIEAFVAKEAVDWVYSNLALESRREAVALVRSFVRIGAISLAQEDEADAIVAGAAEAVGAQSSGANFLRRRRLALTISSSVDSDTPVESRRTSTNNLTNSAASSTSGGSDSGRNSSTTRGWSEQAALFADSHRQYWVFNDQRVDLWRAKISLPSSEEATTRLSRPNLTQRDWRLMLTGADRQSYAAGATLVELGVPNRNLFHIDTGEAQLETNDENGTSIVLGTVGKGAMLGELAAFDNVVLSTARIRAVTAIVVNNVNIAFVSTLFESEPDLYRRFFHSVALQLADQLDQLDKGSRDNDKPGSGATSGGGGGGGGGGGSMAAPVTPSPFKPIGLGVLKVGSMVAKAANASGIKGAEEASTDDRFKELFNITGEVVIHEHAAEGALRAHGRLFVSQHYLAFHAKVFGRQVKTVLPYSSLKSIATSTSDEARIKVVTRKSVTHKFKLESARIAEDVYRIVNGLLGDEASPNLNKLKSRAITHSSSDFDDESDLPSDTNDEDILTDDDWDVILSCSHVATFQRNHKLFEANHQPVGIIQVQRGSCRIERNNVVVATVPSGIILGEVSFIRDSVATADVVADSDVVECHVIPRDKLHALFTRQVAVGGRFMQFVCRLLQQRIADRKLRATTPRPIMINLSAQS
jgi:CRP-like cAMP-binding protein